MQEKSNQKFKCEDCGLRKKAELKPKSFIGRFWYWHIKWCPGWKAYQKSLLNNNL